MFVVGDRSHAKTKEIYAMLRKLKNSGKSFGDEEN